MKAVRILTVLMLIMALAGCRAKKAVIDESSAVVRIDTTKIAADTTGARQTVTIAAADSLTTTQATTDTTKTATKQELNTVVEFVDNGGTVSIDTAGNLTLTGVKSIKGRLTYEKVKAKGFTHSEKTKQVAATEIAVAEESTQAHTERINGTTAKEQRQSHQQRETTAVRPKWYQTVLAKIGGLCCIAVLLWLLFLYLKRKF